MSAVIAAILWAIGQRTNPAIILVYTLCIGNLLSPAIVWLDFLYAERPFPYNLLIFVSLLIVLTVPIYLITSVVVWLISLPARLTLSYLIISGWKFSFVITFAFGVPSFLYHTTKERLEQRNAELQHSVERSTIRLEMQDQELARAARYSGRCFPEKFPRFRDSRSRQRGNPPARWAEITTMCYGSVSTGWESALPTWSEKVYLPLC